jgi:hypothetical protein
MRKFDFTMENEVKSKNAEGEKKMNEFLNEGLFYDYLKDEKNENPWEEKDFISAFIYL